MSVNSERFVCFHFLSLSVFLTLAAAVSWRPSLPLWSIASTSQLTGGAWEKKQHQQWIAHCLRIKTSVTSRWGKWCFCLLQRAPVCLLPLPLELGLVDTGAVDQLVKLSLRRWRRLLGHPRNRCHVGVFDPGRGIPSMQGSGNRRPHLNLESMLAMFLVSMSIWSLWLASLNTLSLQCLNCFLVLRMCGRSRVSPPSSYNHLNKQLFGWRRKLVSYQTSIKPCLSLAWNCWILAITSLSRRFPSVPLSFENFWF